MNNFFYVDGKLKSFACDGKKDLQFTDALEKWRSNFCEEKIAKVTRSQKLGKVHQGSEIASHTIVPITKIIRRQYRKDL